MKFIIKLSTCCLAACLVISSIAISYASSSDTPTPFVQQRNPSNLSLQNQSSYLSTHEVLRAIEHLKEYWALAYPNHKFLPQHLRFHNESLVSSQGAWVYTIYLTAQVDATLITPQEEHPLLQGLLNAYGEMSPEDQALVHSTVESYGETLASSYLVPQGITATYRLVYHCDFNPDSQVQSFPSPQFYFQYDYANEKTQMPDLSTYATGSYRHTQQLREGYQALWSTLQELRRLPAPLVTATYQPHLAAQYAADHGQDYPEYNSVNRLGSDCANFVSFSVHAGGIPTDEEGLWYPSKTTGSYGGINWIRTGYTESLGGVTQYLSQRNLFFLQSNPLLVPQGSILADQDSSHVALITHTDGELTIYAHRSYTTKEFQNYLQEGSYMDYYSPNPALLS